MVHNSKAPEGIAHLWDSEGGSCPTMLWADYCSCVRKHPVVQPVLYSCLRYLSLDARHLEPKKMSISQALQPQWGRHIYLHVACHVRVLLKLVYGSRLEMKEALGWRRKAAGAHDCVKRDDSV